MTTEFVAVTTPEQQSKLAHIAHDIWNEYWPDIIGQAQTDYMVKNFQSLEAIERDMAQNQYEYWFVVADAHTENERVVGYTGGHTEAETNRFFISKIYLFKHERGRHFASNVITFYEHLCVQRGLRGMYLTVNKNNTLGIRAYEGKGFVTIDAVETDIGNGFIMDDYIMERLV